MLPVGDGVKNVSPLSLTVTVPRVESVKRLLPSTAFIALKVYNQTNDRYFTKSSLNTQGLGIIMKKDFNGLRDLFTSKKRKKKKEK